MKISDRNTAVHLLSDDDPGKYYVNPKSGDMTEPKAFLRKYLPRLRPIFREQIHYATRPFLEAYFKAQRKLFLARIDDDIQQDGTLILPYEFGGSTTTFYRMFAIQLDDLSWKVSCTIISFQNGRESGGPWLISVLQKPFDGDLPIDSTSMLAIGMPAKTPILDILGLILFMKYCDLEIKLVAPGKKTAHAKDKYVNDTSHPIAILDSTWFTTIVRSEGFMVGEETGGFFRMQHFGATGSQKKLIWIAPYQKYGYTRKAKILREE